MISFMLCPFLQSLLASLLDGIQCLHKADECMFLFVRQH